MKLFKNLSALDKIEILKFPAYISMLAASCDDKLDEEEKKVAIKFAHTKTFSCNPLLEEFYKEAEKVFEYNIAKLENELPKEKSLREAVIKKELLNLEKIVSKQGTVYVPIMYHSMNTFKEHVSKAHHSVLMDFIFPISISGLTNH